MPVARAARPPISDLRALRAFARCKTRKAGSGALHGAARPLAARILGDDPCLGDMYCRQRIEGHAVRVYVGYDESHPVLAGLVQRCEDWQAEPGWVRESGDEGLIVLETAHHGEIHDQLRRAGFLIIGGSAWGDRLEADGAYGQQVLRDAGLQVAPTHVFDAAIAFVRARAARYVFELDAVRAQPHQRALGDSQH